MRKKWIWRLRQIKSVSRFSQPPTISILIHEWDLLFFPIKISSAQKTLLIETLLEKVESVVTMKSEYEYQTESKTKIVQRRFWFKDQIENLSK